MLIANDLIDSKFDRHSNWKKGGTKECIVFACKILSLFFSLSVLLWLRKFWITKNDSWHQCACIFFKFSRKSTGAATFFPDPIILRRFSLFDLLIKNIAFKTTELRNISFLLNAAVFGLKNAFLGIFLILNLTKKILAGQGFWMNN